MKRDDDHAIQNARGWADTLVQYAAALECDYDRLEELRDERESLVADANAAEGDVEAGEHIKALANWDAENGEELAELIAAATIDGEIQDSADTVRERIQEAPLSVEVRSDWCAPGDTMEAGEFRILLTTGGPALQIRGELDQHKEPCRAWLEYQDWGTPWTQFFDVEQDTLLTFAQQFYFGE